MKCVIVCIALFTVLGLSNGVEPVGNALVGKVQCVVDTMDRISNEFNCDALWQDIQHKMLKNINNLFLCLKLHGFGLQK